MAILFAIVNFDVKLNFWFKGAKHSLLKNVKKPRQNSLANHRVLHPIPGFLP